MEYIFNTMNDNILHALQRLLERKGFKYGESYFTSTGAAFPTLDDWDTYVTCDPETATEIRMFLSILTAPY